MVCIQIYVCVNVGISNATRKGPIGGKNGVAKKESVLVVSFNSCKLE